MKLSIHLNTDFIVEKEKRISSIYFRNNISGNLNVFYVLIVIVPVLEIVPILIFTDEGTIGQCILNIITIGEKQKETNKNKQITTAIKSKLWGSQPGPYCSSRTPSTLGTGVRQRPLSTLQWSERATWPEGFEFQSDFSGRLNKLDWSGNQAAAESCCVLPRCVQQEKKKKVFCLFILCMFCFVCLSFLLFKKIINKDIYLLLHGLFILYIFIYWV